MLCIEKSPSSRDIISFFMAIFPAGVYWRYYCTRTYSRLCVETHFGSWLENHEIWDYLEITHAICALYKQTIIR